MLGMLITTALLLNAPGDWPEPRQNSHLTAVQPMTGSMREAPRILAQYDLGRSNPAVTPVQSGHGETWGVSLIAGALHCFNAKGDTLWKSHPPGLNFDTLIAARDFNGDGQVELLLQAGRSMMPFGAAVLVSLEEGEILWRYDVEPMSYAWYLHAGHYLHEVASEQILVLMHGYPPDPKNGYIALFAFEDDGVLRQRWRYDFEQYTCFPSLLRTDLDGDGRKELVVQTHSRMWFLDAETGAVKHFAQWDVSPANVRSYGLVRFVDLNGDGREDFLCIADFAQHHEVLLNRDGSMEKAWHHGWEESVTTGKVATVYTDPPYADLDGDGHLEIVVSMFNAEGKPEWVLRAYDALTGEVKYRWAGAVAVGLGDLNGNGRAEILVNRTSDATRGKLDGALLLGVNTDAAVGLEVLWEDTGFRANSVRSGDIPVLIAENRQYTMQMNETGEITFSPWEEKPPAPQPEFRNVPALAGPAPPQLLAADLLPTPGNELIMYDGATATVLRLQEGKVEAQSRYSTACLPVIADFDNDGTLDLALATVEASSEPGIRVISPAQGDRVIWEKTLPRTDRAGLPQPRKAYLRAGRFTGAATPDLYFWAGTPLVRSVVLRGSDGSLVWERGEAPGGNRYWGASVNFASVYDVNGDGNEDLVFTNPDYYCVADGPTGALLLGPAFPPDIFSQPSQGLYTLPAILDREAERALVALTNGHYFQGVMTIDAVPLWHTLPEPGAARSGAEGFMRAISGQWVMGYGRQDGSFLCVNTHDGSPRWSFALEGTASDTIACDVDGDGVVEFLVATSHGSLFALAEHGTEPEVRWHWETAAGLGSPIAADLTGNGVSEIAVADTAGVLYILGENQ